MSSAINTTKGEKKKKEERGRKNTCKERPGVQSSHSTQRNCGRKRREKEREKGERK